MATTQSLDSGYQHNMLVKKESAAKVLRNHPAVHLRQVLHQVQQQIAPVWPLQDYVAVNPYQGLAHLDFLEARRRLRSVSGMELLMPAEYYCGAFKAGKFSEDDIVKALNELQADGQLAPDSLTVSACVSRLKEPDSAVDDSSSFAEQQLHTITDLLGSRGGQNWSEIVLDEISRHVSSHYDRGQAIWSSPWQHLPLYQAWRSAAVHDRSLEFLGVPGFRSFVASLPHDVESTLIILLNQLGVPSEIWASVLYCQALSMPGWSAWTRYQQRQKEADGLEDTDFFGLLAIRLAYEVALANRFQQYVDWSSINQTSSESESEASSEQDVLWRCVMLKAMEIAYRKSALSALAANNVSEAREPVADASEECRLAQMVFCIDVRSERIRRHLEATSEGIETFGFAGFFGLPIQFLKLGELTGKSQVPVLINPKFQVREGDDDTDPSVHQQTTERRQRQHFFTKVWKDFQTRGLNPFAFVETAGLFYAWKLFAKVLGFQGSEARTESTGMPSLSGLESQGIDLEQQADLAESILKGIGIVQNFAPLVVFCGHGSQMDNNPTKAGFDCGACGGHSGEPNARLAALLLNRPQVRNKLASRGVMIPAGTTFLAAVHNTTTDEVRFFDVQQLSASQQSQFVQLEQHLKSATRQTRSERATVLPDATAVDLVRRSSDWSEIRPEWGLAGNAAMIVAPRSWTRNRSLDGRSFLHSYDYRKDPGFGILEQILTAPLVVANWINMQYYASTVDPEHFGSGNKTIHNVVGNFGLLAGNSGDLMTGLPWQSVHNGQDFYHEPLRLLALIAAPRQAISQILQRHQSVAHLVTRGWIQLVAVEDSMAYRYTRSGQWELCSAEG